MTNEDQEPCVVCGRPADVRVDRSLVSMSVAGSQFKESLGDRAARTGSAYCIADATANITFGRGNHLGEVIPR